MAKSKDKGPNYLTTYQVSKLLGVSLPTVVNWVNASKLNAHRTPGGHRRITRSDLIVFARTFNYPLSQEFLREAGGTPRVLIVDDETAFAEMVSDYLSMKGGLEVETAESGFAAGMTVARFRPDLILMDIMMPDMDGFEVLKILKSVPDTTHIPVIACTSYRDAEIQRRIEAEPFDGFLQKPLRLELLLQEIRAKLKLKG